MKQPQLGKKISALRLAKGLTQTELAEKCNLNLRTIQRIESTEVTPRSYTLKLIFKNLDFDGFSTINKNPFVNFRDLFNLKKNGIRNIVFLFAIIIVSIIVFKLSSNNKTRSVTEVTETIKKSQVNIKRWMNTKQVDSVLSMYSDDACILYSICGKLQIRQMMNEVVDNDYELIDYTSLSINVSDTIAVEKYKNTYKYKGRVNTQIGITEWHYKEGKWLIVNDVFRD